MTALLKVNGKIDVYLAEELIEDGVRIRALGRWRHREGAYNEKARLYGARGWRSWPSRQVQVQPRSWTEVRND